MKITSIQNERIKFIFNLKEKKHREQAQLFLVEGEHLVREAYRVQRLKSLITTGDIPSFIDPSIEIIDVSDSVFSKLASTKTPQRWVGIVQMNETVELDETSPIIALDGIQDPGNAGTIVRSGLAFGVRQFVFSNDSVDVYNEKFIRATQGAFFHSLIVRADLPPYLKELSKKYTIYMTLVNPNSHYLPTITIQNPWILVLGNEGSGIRPNVTQIPSIPLYIPIHSEVDSLNVAAAAAICLYEMTKSR